MLIVSRRHECASAQNQNVTLGRGGIPAPEKMGKPGSKPGAGLWAYTNKRQPMYLPVASAFHDPNLDPGGHVAIWRSELFTVTTVMTVMTIIKKCHDC